MDQTILILLLVIIVVILSFYFIPTAVLLLLVIGFLTFKYMVKPMDRTTQRSTQEDPLPDDTNIKSFGKTTQQSTQDDPLPDNDNTVSGTTEISPDNIFSTFALLAQACYCRENEKVPVIPGFSLVRFNSERQVWLWYIEPENRWIGKGAANYVIGIRGSHTAADWTLKNQAFLFDSIGISNNFHNVITDYREKVIELLKNSSLPSGDKHVSFVGHSLGAAIAEALHTWSLNKKTFSSKFCVTFESPGQPIVYRAKHFAAYRQIVEDKEFYPVPNIWTLNNIPNVVNSTSIPCASHFFSPDNPGNFGATFFIEFWKGGCFGAAKAVSDMLYSTNIDGHRMPQIKALIDGHEFRETDPKNWTPYTLNFLRSLYDSFAGPNSKSDDLIHLFLNDLKPDNKIISSGEEIERLWEILKVRNQVV